MTQTIVSTGHQHYFINSEYSHGIFIQQSSANITQLYTPNTKFWIAATEHLQNGKVLSQPVSQSQFIEFKDDNRNLRASFEKDQTWTFSS